VKIIVWLTILSVMNLIGCYSSTIINKDILFKENQEDKISDLTIVTNEKKKIKLQEGSYKVVGDTLYAKEIRVHTAYNEFIDIKIALTDIRYAEIDELDDLATVGMVVGLAALVMLILVFKDFDPVGPIFPTK